jgi:flagellar protein FliO/FliZ
MTADWQIYLRSVLVLLLVLGLIFAAAWIAKRFNLGGAAALGRRSRRLAIAEVLPVDARHRLVLVRRDATEHLLLIGGGSDILIESSIRAGGSALADKEREE